MAVPEDDTTNTVEFQIDFKCTTNPETAPTLQFAVDVPFTAKETTPSVSEWTHNRHRWSFSIEFTKKRAIQWQRDGVISINPQITGSKSTSSPMTIDMTSFITGSTSIHQQCHHPDFEEMESLQIRITLNKPIMSTLWNSECLPFHFEICSIDNLPVSTNQIDSNSNPKKLTVKYHLPAVRDPIISQNINFSKKSEANKTPNYNND